MRRPRIPARCTWCWFSCTPVGCEPLPVHPSPACGQFPFPWPLVLQVHNAAVLFKSRVVQWTASIGVLQREQVGKTSTSFHAESTMLAIIANGTIVLVALTLKELRRAKHA